MQHASRPQSLTTMTRILLLVSLPLPISFDYYSHHNFAWVKFCLAFSHMHFLLDIEIAFRGFLNSTKLLPPPAPSPNPESELL